MGIRRRIVLLVGLAVALAIVAAAVGSYFAARSSLLGQVDDSLTTQAKAVLMLAEQSPDASSLPKRLPKRLPGPPQAAPPLGDRDGLRIQRIDQQGGFEGFPRSGGRLPITEGARAIASQGAGESLDDTIVNGQSYRVFTLGAGDDGAIMVGRSLEGVERVLTHLRLTLALLVIGGVALAASLAWLIGRRVVAPIKKLTETVEHITATNDLGRRIEVEGSDELARLASRFDAMLETIAEHQEALGQSVNSQRQLVADASHELRTPVAAIRTGIETVLAHPDLSVEDRTVILAAADERIEELTELILDLIELARGDEYGEPVDEVRLDVIAADSIERLRRLAPQRAIETQLQPTLVEGRPDRLFRAINNLLDNAHKYSPLDQPIEIQVSRGAVVVRDHGPGVPEADLPRLFDRFWRGPNSRHRPGSGLGLAIVRQVADAGDGTVTVENQPDQGAIFRFTLPEAGGPAVELGSPTSGARSG